MNSSEILWGTSKSPYKYMKRSILQNGLYTLFILLVIIGFIFPMQAFGQAGTLNLTEVGFHGNTLTDGDACSINIPGITYNIYGVNSSGGKIGNILVLDYSPPRESHYFFVDDGSYFGLPINRLIIESGSGNSLSEHLPTILVGSIYPW